jgi:diaminobutyrate-2-oxoglutarate transaminase
LVLVRRELDVWQPGEHNGTFRGNNLAFVAGTAALDYWTDAEFLARLTLLSRAVREAVEGLGAQFAGRISATGRGLMSGLRFTSAQTAADVRRKLFDRGVLAELSGGGRVLKLLPPLTMPVADWRSTFGLITEVVSGAVGAPTIAAG